MVVDGSTKKESRFKVCWVHNGHVNMDIRFLLRTELSITEIIFTSRVNPVTTFIMLKFIVISVNNTLTLFTVIENVTFAFFFRFEVTPCCPVLNIS